MSERQQPLMSPSPFRRATIAVTPMLSESRNISIKNFGCVVTPTAEMARSPNMPTISVSTNVSITLSSDSTIAGHAMPIHRP